MASKKLKKYLAYYQKVLKDDPENIEARLRLAAIFREIGRTRHAVDEYVVASKLLAKEGLPLEAIAACKAVLELDPTHTEIQYFLARLYAQVPEATGNAARIAQPVQGKSDSSPRIMPVKRATDEFDDVPERDLEEALITLNQPKDEDSTTTRNVDVIAEVWAPQDDETRLGNPESGPPPLHRPAREEERTRADKRSTDLATPEEATFIQGAGLDEATENLFDDEGDPTGPLSGSRVDEVLVTQEIIPVRRARSEELFATQDLDPQDILEELTMDTYESRARMPTSRAWSPVFRETLRAEEATETIELSVFDMDSLGLTDDDLDFALDGDLEELSEISDGDEVTVAATAVLNVNRSTLPVIPLFSQLHPDVFMQLLRVIDVKRVLRGETVIEPTMSSRSLYVIVKGETSVWRMVDGERIDLAVLREGEFFGEFRLLTGRDGMATVAASTDVDLLEISEEVLNTIGEAHPEIWDVLWDFYYQRMLNNLLASSEMFRPLTPTERANLSQHFEVQELVTGEALLNEGQACHYVYLVLAGEVVVERDLGGVVDRLAEMREGEFFGVASSLGGDPYPADISSTRDTTLLRLPGEIFRKLVDENPAVDREVQRVIHRRRKMNAQFSSGIAPYGELGIAQND